MICMPPAVPRTFLQRAAMAAALALLLCTGRPAHADPASGTLRNASSTGCTADVQGEVQMRDVFTVTRGGQVLGEVMVIGIHGSQVTVLPRASFRGAPQRGDHLEFTRHANAPRELSSAAAPPNGGRSAAPSSGGRSGQRADVASSPIAIQVSCLSTPRTDGGIECIIDTTLKNEGSQGFENVIVELDCAATSGAQTTTRNAGNLKPGESRTQRWRRTFTAGMDPAIRAHVMYFFGTDRVKSTAETQAGR